MGLWNDTSLDSRINDALDAAHELASKITGFNTSHIGSQWAAFYTIPAARSLALPREAPSLTSIVLFEGTDSTGTNKAAEWTLDPTDMQTLVYTGASKADRIYATESVVAEWQLPLKAVVPFTQRDTHVIKAAIERLAVDLFGRLPETNEPSEPILKSAQSMLESCSINTGIA